MLVSKGQLQHKLRNLEQDFQRLCKNSQQTNSGLEDQLPSEQQPQAPSADAYLNLTMEQGMEMHKEMELEEDESILSEHSSDDSLFNVCLHEFRLPAKRLKMLREVRRSQEDFYRQKPDSEEQLSGYATSHILEKLLKLQERRQQKLDLYDKNKKMREERKLDKQAKKELQKKQRLLQEKQNLITLPNGKRVKKGSQEHQVMIQDAAKLQQEFLHKISLRQKQHVQSHYSQQIIDNHNNENNPETINVLNSAQKQEQSVQKSSTTKNETKAVSIMQQITPMQLAMSVNDKKVLTPNQVQSLENRLYTPFPQLAFSNNKDLQSQSIQQEQQQLVYQQLQQQESLTPVIVAYESNIQNAQVDMQNVNKFDLKTPDKQKQSQQQMFVIPLQEEPSGEKFLSKSTPVAGLEKFNLCERQIKGSCEETNMLQNYQEKSLSKITPVAGLERFDRREYKQYGKCTEEAGSCENVNQEQFKRDVYLVSPKEFSVQDMTPVGGVPEKPFSNYGRLSFLPQVQKQANQEENNQTQQASGNNTQQVDQIQQSMEVEQEQTIVQNEGNQLQFLESDNSIGLLQQNSVQIPGLNYEENFVEANMAKSPEPKRQKLISLPNNNDVQVKMESIYDYQQQHDTNFQNQVAQENVPPEIINLVSSDDEDDNIESDGGIDENGNNSSSQGRGNVVGIHTSNEGYMGDINTENIGERGFEFCINQYSNVGNVNAAATQFLHEYNTNGNMKSGTIFDKGVFDFNLQRNNTSNFQVQNGNENNVVLDQDNRGTTNVINEGKGQPCSNEGESDHQEGYQGDVEMEDCRGNQLAVDKAINTSPLVVIDMQIDEDQQKSVSIDGQIREERGWVCQSQQCSGKSLGFDPQLVYKKRQVDVSGFNGGQQVLIFTSTDEDQRPKSQKSQQKAAPPAQFTNVILQDFQVQQHAQFSNHNTNVVNSSGNQAAQCAQYVSSAKEQVSVNQSGRNLQHSQNLEQKVVEDKARSVEEAHDRENQQQSSVQGLVTPVPACEPARRRSQREKHFPVMWWRNEKIAENSQGEVVIKPTPDSLWPNDRIAKDPPKQVKEVHVQKPKNITRKLGSQYAEQEAGVSKKGGRRKVNEVREIQDVQNVRGRKRTVAQVKQIESVQQADKKRGNACRIKGGGKSNRK